MSLFSWWLMGGELSSACCATSPQGLSDRGFDVQGIKMLNSRVVFFISSCLFSFFMLDVSAVLLLVEILEYRHVLLLHV